MSEALAALRPEHSRHPMPPRDPGRPKGLNALGMLAHNPELTKAYNVFNGYILFASSITPRQRELLILRVAHRRDCIYEWVQHTVLAADAGITTEEVERVRTDPGAELWSAVDRALLAAADELVDDARLSDGTWAVLADEMGTDQLLDLIFTVGAYDLLAMAMRTFDLELDDDLLGRLASPSD